MLSSPYPTSSARTPSLHLRCPDDRDSRWLLDTVRSIGPGCHLGCRVGRVRAWPTTRGEFPSAGHTRSTRRCNLLSPRDERCGGWPAPDHARHADPRAPTRRPLARAPIATSDQRSRGAREPGGHLRRNLSSRLRAPARPAPHGGRPGPQRCGGARTAARSRTVRCAGTRSAPVRSDRSSSRRRDCTAGGSWECATRTRETNGYRRPYRAFAHSASRDVSARPHSASRSNR